MRTIQACRSSEVDWISLIQSIIDEVSVVGLADIARQRIRNLQVHMPRSGKRGFHVLFERHLEPVINGAARGKKHLQEADVRFNTRKRTCGTRRASRYVHGRIQSVRCEVADARCGVRTHITGNPSRRGGLRHWSTLTDRCVNRGNRICYIQKARISCTVDIDRQQRVSRHIAHVICAQHHALPEFSLHPEVHLHGSGTAVIRRKQGNAVGVRGVIEGVPDEITIGGWPCCYRRLLELCLIRRYHARHIAHGLSTDRRSVDSSGTIWKRNRNRCIQKTPHTGTKEQSTWEPTGSVKQNIVENGILVEQPDAASENRLSVLRWIPSDS